MYPIFDILMPNILIRSDFTTLRFNMSLRGKVVLLVYEYFLPNERNG